MAVNVVCLYFSPLLCLTSAKNLESWSSSVEADTALKFSGSFFSLRYMYTLKSFTAVSVLIFVLLEYFSVRIFSKSSEFSEANLPCVCYHFYFADDTCQRAVCKMKSDWLLRTCVLTVIG